MDITGIWDVKPENPEEGPLPALLEGSQSLSCARGARLTPALWQTPRRAIARRWRGCAETTMKTRFGNQFLMTKKRGVWPPQYL